MTNVVHEDHAAFALEEYDFWEKNKDTLTGSMGEVVGREFGRSPKGVRVRSQIFRAGPDVAILWDRIEKGMGLYVAHRILVSAMKADDGLLEAINRELAEYDSLGPDVLSPTGGTFKRRPPRERKSDPPPQSSIPKPPSSSDSIPKNPWRKIRSAMDELLEEQLKSADKDVIDEVRAAFKAEVQRMVIWLRSRVNAGADVAPMDVILSQGQSRKNVLDWCKTLKVQAPKPGLSVDEEELKRKYRAFARTTHPDRPSGNTEKMAIINDAYQGLISYNFSLKSDI